MFHKVNNLEKNCVSNAFYLDEFSIFEITGTPRKVNFPRWMQIAHCEDKRLSMILLSGESIELPDNLQIEKDTRLNIRYSAALPNISADGLVFEICFLESDQNHTADLICALPIAGGMQPPYWRMINLDISHLAGHKGRLIFRCQPGAKNDPSGDWLAISDLCIGREDQLSLLKARSFHEHRSKNEIEHFSIVYRHSMYSSIQDQHAELAASKPRPVRKFIQGNDVAEISNGTAITDAEPLPGEFPYDYATRLLAECIPQTPPNFLERLKSRAQSGNRVKVLSLCSGAARIEADYAAQVGTNVEWSLLDINVDLLGLASKQFAPEIKLDLIEANVNELSFSGEKWDIILCVSALHHIVELERLMKFCHNSLNEDGEFWSIGEYVGRNGNRLWPDAREEANKLFHQLPKQYRINHHTSELDDDIPDNDYSVGCFEGIRSENIEPLLDRWFHPVDVYRRNCFLWRLINLTYSDNYDLKSPDDRKWIIRMVNAEVEHFRAGGRGTELFGVYRPRLLDYPKTKP
jgi:SAM-dependent methyltransferase